MATQPSEKHAQEIALGDELAVIAQRAQTFTSASGAAIAMREGNNEFITQARCGSTAPDIDSEVQLDGSFAGQAIKSGKDLRCDDAETDPRVNVYAARSLGIRSMVVIPIKDERQVFGILSVFAPSPQSFTITHVAVLKTMADQVALLARRQRRGRPDVF